MIIAWCFACVWVCGCGSMRGVGYGCVCFFSFFSRFAVNRRGDVCIKFGGTKGRVHVSARNSSLEGKRGYKKHILLVTNVL